MLWIKSILNTFLNALLNPHNIRSGIQPERVLDEIKNFSIIDMKTEDDKANRMNSFCVKLPSRTVIAYTVKKPVLETIACSMPKAHRTIFYFRDGRLLYTEYSSGKKFHPPDETYKKNAEWMLTELKAKVAHYLLM